MSKATKNPLLALLEDDDFSGYEKDDVDVSALAGASILNLDDTREISFFTQQHQQRGTAGPAKSKSAFQPTTSFQMSPPKPRRTATATATVAAPLASAKVDNKPTTAKSLKSEPRNGYISPAMKKVQTQLAQVKAEMDQTKKLAFEIPMSPLDSPVDTKANSAAAAAARDDETRQITASFDIHDDDDAAVAADDDDDDADDIVISLPKPAAKATALVAKQMHVPAPAVTVAAVAATSTKPTSTSAPVAPKTPTAADLRARAKAIDQQPTASQPQPQPVNMSLEERVAMLEKELREERAARIQLEKRLAHLFK